MIRRAIPDDATAIEAIWTPVILNSLATFNSHPKPATEIETMIIDRDQAGHATWVAELNGHIVGFLTYAQFRGGIGYRHTMEHTIVLGDAARGAGLGRALMGVFEDHAKAAGAHSVVAGVSGKNPAGIAFHERLGYRLCTVLPQVGHKFEEFIDLHLMQKFL